MKELTITLRVKPTGIMKKDEYHFLADPFSFTPSITDSISGKLFDCSKDVTIEIPDADTLREFSSTRFAIVYLRDSLERYIAIGTDDIPALVSISANLNTATLQISCKMLHSPFLPL